MNQLLTRNITSSPSDAENLAELLYSIGHRELENHRSESAVNWLGKACKVVEENEAFQLSQDRDELGLNILHEYVRTLLTSEHPASVKEAGRILSLLRKRHGHKLAVMVLQLETICRDPSSSANTVYTELTAVIQSMHLLESNHKMAMHYLHHLHGLNNELATRCLQNYIRQRLAAESDYPYAEQAVITLVWMITTFGQGDQFNPDNLLLWLDDINVTWEHPLSAEACHGAFVVSYIKLFNTISNHKKLLWKMFESVPNGQVERICGWCRVMLHDFFSNIGETNKGKVER